LKLKALTDELIPTDTVLYLRAIGHNVQDIKELGMSGQDDEAILRYARKKNRVLITADSDFANLKKFPLIKEPGRIVLSIGSTSSFRLNRALERLFRLMKLRDFKGNLITVTQDNVTITFPDGNSKTRPLP
jgi:predicted nuclease of predicted toxin-antitoxin system